MSRIHWGKIPRLFILVILASGMAMTLRLYGVEAAPLAQIITTTPMADGTIVHIVQDGENLASIAEVYGVSMADIRAFNGMAPTSNLIFPGQKLIIRLPLPPSETPTLTPTVPRSTRTPTVVTPTRTPRATRTVTPTVLPSATPNPASAAAADFFARNQRLLLLAMGVFCAAGLGWTLWSGFRPSKRGNKAD